MINNNQWWKYYGFENEPCLSTEPLRTKDELELFFGREIDLERLGVLLSGSHKRTLMLTGKPGVGKSTIINKLLHEEKGFIHVNLSNINLIEDAEIGIANACIDTFERIDKGKASEFRERNMLNIAETAGVNKKGKIGKIVEVEFGKSESTTYAPIRNLEVRQIIKEIFNELVQEHRIYLILDESDFFDVDHSAELIHLSQRMKDVLPAGSVLLLINRDITGKFQDQYYQITSLVRTTFKNLHPLESIWRTGEAHIPQILEKRIKVANPTPEYEFPLAKDACEFIDVMSSGKFKLLIQYFEHVLIFGAVTKEKLPLSYEFVKEEIFKTFKEVVQLDEQEESVLLFLKENPTYLSDPRINELYPRTTLQRIKKRLLERMLIYIDTTDSSGKNILFVTELGESVLENVLSE